jgi:hypothetical protein
MGNLTSTSIYLPPYYVRSLNFTVPKLFSHDAIRTASGELECRTRIQMIDCGSLRHYIGTVASRAAPEEDPCLH